MKDSGFPGPFFALFPNCGKKRGQCLQIEYNSLWVKERIG